MNSWLPIFATLSGAIVAGAISLLVNWLSNRNALQHARLHLAEDRARWATEKQLSQLEDYYAEIDRLYEATHNFRIQQAWEATCREDEATKMPDWVLPYDRARSGLEEGLDRLYLKSSLLDDEIQEQFKAVREYQLKWFKSSMSHEAAEVLMEMEREIAKFRERISRRYREIFRNRRNGSDVVSLD
ncbi:MAG: hypothetical protein JSR60_19555 [Proteobacteria bacterium]|nr:hypothetical protein [Pseudomonadota bacterium]